MSNTDDNVPNTPQRVSITLPGNASAPAASPAGNQMSSGLQYLRKIGLVVGNASGAGLDLSNMQIHFNVFAADTNAPNRAIIRVMNLSTTTSKMVQKEFQTVALQAGYQGQGNYGLIFQGTIKQFKRGRISALDSYLDILAADGDEAYNFAFVNKSLAAGSSQMDQVKAAASSMNQYGVTQGQLDGLGTTGTGGVLPRGKVLFGLAKDQLQSPTDTAGVSWSIDNGKLVTVPLTGYLPGTAVVLNAATGLDGVPEQTDNGIEINCLLNPNIKIGTRVQINNADINSSTQLQPGFNYSTPPLLADVTMDGFYRVLVAEHEGECPYGAKWTTHLTCLAVNASSVANNSVLAYG